MSGDISSVPEKDAEHVGPEKHVKPEKHVRKDFVFLFYAIILMMLLYPFLENSRLGCIVLSLVSWVVLFSLTWALYHYRAPYSRLLIVLAVLSFLGGLTLSFSISGFLLIFISAVRIAFYSLAFAAVMHLIFRGSHATFARLSIAICGYLIIGILWAYIYSLIMICDHESFKFSMAVADQAHRPDHRTIDLLHFNYIYYSFITLTTVGYGDITPVSTLAKTFSYLESLFGQLYLAVLIARIIGIKTEARE